MAKSTEKAATSKSAATASCVKRDSKALAKRDHNFYTAKKETNPELVKANRRLNRAINSIREAQNKV